MNCSPASGLQLHLARLLRIQFSLECSGVPLCSRVPSPKCITFCYRRSTTALVVIHISFCRIYTLYKQYCASPGLNCRSSHIFDLGALEKCILGSLEKSASQTSHHLQNILGACSQRGNRVETAPRGFDSRTRQPVPLFSPPPHWYIPRAIDYFTIDRSTILS